MIWTREPAAARTGGSRERSASEERRTRRFVWKDIMSGEDELDMVTKDCTRPLTRKRKRNVPSKVYNMSKHDIFRLTISLAKTSECYVPFYMAGEKTVKVWLRLGPAKV